jgi:hypothetical protein
MNNNKQSGKSGPSLLQNAKEGFGLGIGVSLAQRAVSAVFGAPEVRMVPVKEPTEYEKCLIENRDIGICAHLLKKE